MAFVIPDEYTTWADKLSYCLAYKTKLQDDYNAHGASFNAGTLTSDEWASYQAQFEPYCVDCNVEISSLQADPPTDSSKIVLF